MKNRIKNEIKEQSKNTEKDMDYRQKNQYLWLSEIGLQKRNRANRGEAGFEVLRHGNRGTEAGWKNIRSVV